MIGALRKWRRNPSGLVWRGSGVIFLGNWLMEVAEQLHSAPRRRVPMDRADHDQMGPHRIGIDGKAQLSSHIA